MDQVVQAATSDLFDSLSGFLKGFSIYLFDILSFFAHLEGGKVSVMGLDDVNAFKSFFLEACFSGRLVSNKSNDCVFWLFGKLFKKLELSNVSQIPRKSNEKGGTDSKATTGTGNQIGRHGEDQKLV